MSVPLKKLLSIAAVGCLLFVVFGCHRETEQDKVKKVITSVQKAAEEKDVKKIITSLSRTYRDSQGNDYDSIKGFLLGFFFRHQRVHVYIPEIAISVDDGSAKAEFQAVLTGGESGAAGIMPESLGMYAFEVSLRKEDKEWKVVSTTWKRVGEGSEQKGVRDYGFQNDQA
jgi:hypothetical protein